jgi:hypothetical protein
MALRKNEYPVIGSGNKGEGRREKGERRKLGQKA